MPFIENIRRIRENFTRFVLLWRIRLLRQALLLLVSDSIPCTLFSKDGPRVNSVPDLQWEIWWYANIWSSLSFYSIGAHLTPLFLPFLRPFAIRCSLFSFFSALSCSPFVVYFSFCLGLHRTRYHLSLIFAPPIPHHTISFFVGSLVFSNDLLWSPFVVLCLYRLVDELWRVLVVNLDLVKRGKKNMFLYHYERQRYPLVHLVDTIVWLDLNLHASLLTPSYSPFLSVGHAKSQVKRHRSKTTFNPHRITINDNQAVKANERQEQSAYKEWL